MKSILVTVTTLLLSLGAVLPAQEAPREPGETNVSYRSADGTQIRGYLARPSGSGPHPAVLMIHEWWGLNRDTTLLADALAREGFIVLAADAFRGSVAETPQQAMAQLRSTPQEQIAADLDAALSFLMDHQAVDPRRVGSVGFCFGGTQSMYLGTRAQGLSAVVTLYGSGPIQEAAALGNMAANDPVLGIFGEEDGSIPVAEVRGFEQALSSGGVENTITIYPNVGHAFVKSTTYNRGGATQEDWEQSVEFFREEL